MSTQPLTSGLPARARVVVIGGGVIGTSVAYHLGLEGWTDTVLLERDRLTSGTTWHSAGLMVTFGSLSETSTRMRQYTRDLYSRLEAETGLSTGFKPVGFIEVAADEGRLEEYRRVSAFNRMMGVDVHEITPKEVQDLFPLAHVDDLLAGFYVAEDGRVNPVDVTMSLARGAKNRGVTIVEGVAATGFTTAAGRVTGVVTDQGTIECEYVVNCTGMWGRQVAALAGVEVPLQAAEHYYLITEEMSQVDPTWPVLEDPSSYAYIREEGGGLMVGLFETRCAPWQLDGIPSDSSFVTIPPDWDRMAPYLEKAMARVPASLEAGVRTFFCGPESFTPDLAPVVGESPELRGYFVAAGLNSIGVLTGGGMGRVVANWVMSGEPDVDVTAMHIDRLQPYQANREYRATRTVESLGMVYQTHFPGKAMKTARDAKRSPIHERLVAANAYFKDVSGWESPGWFAPEGVAPEIAELSWGRQNWFPYWEAEHRAVREAAGLIDMSFMAKFIVQGRDAGAVLDRVSANAVNGEPGVITYTQWLNESGRLEADLTVTKISEEEFLVVASDTAHRHALTHLRRAIGDSHAFVADVTSGMAMLSLQGPRSREVLAAVTGDDVSDAALGYRSVREIQIGFARVTCARITYVGELGYELYVPTEQAVHVYDRIVAAGIPLGLRHVGLSALSSLRLEKGYRDYGHDIDNTDDPFEVGLGFAVAMDKPGGFIGRDAVAERRAAGPLTQRLVSIRLTDPDAMLFHAEPVLRDGVAVGYVRVGSYGHTLGGSVGLAFVSAEAIPCDGDWLAGGTWEVNVAGNLVPAEVSIRPFYDPKNERLRA